MTQAQNVNNAKLYDFRYLGLPGLDTLYLSNIDIKNKIIIYENNYSLIYAEKNDLIFLIKKRLSSKYQDKCDSIVADTLLNRLKQNNTHLFIELEETSNINELVRTKMPFILLDMIINNKVSIFNKKINTLTSKIYYMRNEGGLCCCNHTLSFDFECENIILKFGCSDVIILCE